MENSGFQADSKVSVNSTDCPDRNSKWNSLRKRGNRKEANVSECFDEKCFETIGNRNRRCTLLNRDTKSYQLLEFVFQILSESDQIQISEKDLIFKTRGRLESNITNVYLNEMSPLEKEDLFILALQAEMETSRKRIVISNGKSSKQIVHQTSSSKRKSQPECMQGGFVEQSSILGKLSQILDISAEQQKEWTQKVTRRNTMIDVHVEGVKFYTKDELHSSTIFCKVGLISAKDVTNKLDSFSGGTKVTSEKQKESHVVWNESIQLPINIGECLCVEVWSNSRIQEKSKKRGDSHGQSISTKMGQCLIQPEAQRNISGQSHPLLSLSGKDVKGSISLAIEIQEQAELRVLEYTEHQKYNLFKSLIQEAITYQISNYIPLSFGRLEQSIEEVCRVIGNEMKLCEFQISTAHWSHISKIAQFIESKRELEYNLILLNSKWETESIRLEEEEKERLLTNIKDFYDKHLEQMKFILINCPPTSEDASDHINEHLGILLKLFRFLKDRKIFDSSDKFEFHLESKIKDGVYSWYSRTLEMLVSRGDFMTYLKTLIIFCQHIINLMRMMIRNYPGQNSIVKFDIPRLVMTTIDPFLAGEIEQFLDQISGNRDSANDDHLIMNIFALERKVKLLLKEKSNLYISNMKLHLDVHGEWFKQFVNDWLNILRKTTVENVNKAIEVESSLKIGYGDKNVTSSLIDIAFCLIPNYVFYVKMQESKDIGMRLHISYQVVLLIQETLENYVQKMSIKMSKIVGMGQDSEFKMTREMCQILNNIHFVKEYLEEVPKKFEASPDENLKALLSEAEDGLKKKKIQLLWEISPPFSSQFKRYFKLLLNSDPDTPILDAIADLMNWLLGNIQVCSAQKLNDEIFNELLQVLWANIVEAIRSLVTDKQTSNGRYDLISKSLKILFEFFHNDGEGLSHETIQSVDYLELCDQLERLNMNSSDLVLECARIIADQIKDANNQHGSLTYSIVYHPDSEMLEVTIMSVTNICNPSFTGKFNPLIKTDILPKFENIEPVHTKTLKHSKNIFIHEVLHLPIPKTDIKNVVVRISLVYVDSIGLRDQGYSGSVYIRGDNIGHSSSDLKGFLEQQDKSVGGLVERNFAFPPTDENEYNKILKERTDSIAQRYMQELNESSKKEIELKKYSSKVSVFSNLFQRSSK